MERFTKIDPDKQEYHTNNEDKTEETSAPPKKRVCCVDIRWWVAAVAVTACLDGIHGGFLVSINVSLERRFELSTTQFGVISSCSDFTMLASLIITTYGGNLFHKPRGLGVLITITSLGYVLWLVPIIIATAQMDASELPEKSCYNNGTTSYTDTEVCMRTRNTSAECTAQEEVNLRANQTAFIIFCIAEVLVGLGIYTPYTLGFGYIEENSESSKAILYIGVVGGVFNLGPLIGIGLGAGLTYISEDLTCTNPDNKDPNFVGAWWLGFLFILILYLICLPVTFSFPRVLQPQTCVGKTENDGANETSNISLRKLFSGFFVSIWKFITNPVYMLVMVGMNIAYFGRGSYVSKYLQVQFNTGESVANTMLAGISGAASCIGSFLGGLFLSKMRPRISQIALWVVVTSLLTSVTKLAETFIGCPQPSYSGQYSDGEYIPFTGCSSNCSCTETVFEPVCGENAVSYISPCFAGCSTPLSELNSTSCACSVVRVGQCDTGCNMLVTYAVISAIESVVGTLSQTPWVVLLMRVVGRGDGALAVAFAFALLGLVVSIPSSILFGNAVDGTCIWNLKSSCGDDLSCRLYDLERLRYVLHAPGVAGWIIGALLYLGAWHLSRSGKYDRQEDVTRVDAEKLTSLH